ncbi:MAG: LamG domain-containing protein [Fibrobacteria bacterium]|nr:LamG domain-containing protein [Fibrobacteria bacterium]
MIESGPVVFDAQGYAGVWHLENALSLPDGSNAGNQASAQNMTSENTTTGNIGNALNFNGIDQNLTTTKQYDDPGAFSFSLWFKTDSAGGKLIAFEKDSLEYVFYNNDRLIYMDDSGHLHFGVFPPTPDSLSAEDSLLIGPPDSIGKSPGIRRIISSPERYDDGNWHQLVATLSPFYGQSLYIDGKLISINTAVKEAEHISGFWKIGGGFMTGWNNWPSNSYFKGSLDEVQILHKAVSETWVRLSYENQKIGSSLISFKE